MPLLSSLRIVRESGAEESEIIIPIELFRRGVHLGHLSKDKARAQGQGKAREGGE